MKEKLRSHAGRMFLLAVGILLTSTVGHAAARMMALQMAQGQGVFAFELAVTLAGLLVAAYIVAVSGKRPLESVVVATQGSAGATPMPSHNTVPLLSAAQLNQLRLPPGMRLDSHEAIMIATGTTERRIVFVNAAFARLTGHEARQWIGRSADLLAPEGPLRMESLLWLDTEPDGREAHWIARLHRGDGALFCAEAHLHPVAARNGTAGHVVLVMTDVTSRMGIGKSREAGARPAAITGAIRKSA